MDTNAAGCLRRSARRNKLAIARCFSMLPSVSLTEIKDAVESLSARELAELAAFIRERENAAWDQQIDEDFAEDGRLRPVLEEVRENIRTGRLEELP
jgi:hypothetical protein